MPHRDAVRGGHRAASAGLLTKRCGRCQRVKDLDEFGYGNGSHGRAGYCLACKRDYDAERKARPGVMLRERADQRAYSQADAALRDRHYDEYRELLAAAKRYWRRRLGVP